MLNIAPEQLCADDIQFRTLNGECESDSSESISDCERDSRSGTHYYSGQKLDMWACGIVLYQLFYGTPPFVESSAEKLVSTIAGLVCVSCVGTYSNILLIFVLSYAGIML